MSSIQPGRTDPLRSEETSLPDDSSVQCSCGVMSMPSPAGEIVVLRAAGEVDLQTRHILRDALAAALARRPAHLLVDLAGLSFCDGGGLMMLLQAGVTAAAQHTSYSVSAAPRHAARVWAVVRPESRLPVQHLNAAAGVLAALAGQAAERHDDRLVPEGTRRPTAGTGDPAAYRTLLVKHRTAVSAAAPCTPAPPPAGPASPPGIR